MRIINWLLKLSNRASYSSFINDISKASTIQEQYLMSLVKENAITKFGQIHGFSRINSIEDFQTRVPISDYDSHEPYIKMHMDNALMGLVREPIELFELSSGSTAASKYIPYTRGLQDDYMAGIKPWLYDLYARFPSLMKGKSYWSISPISTERQYTSSGIPIGFQDDTGYFDTLQKHLFNILFVIPSDIKFIKDIDDFRYITMLFLLKEKRLSLISVWNPTFLKKLLDVFFIYKDQLIKDLYSGTITPPNKSSLPVGLRKRFKASRKRARALENLTNSNGTQQIFSRIWPHLTIVSCWDQGNAKVYAQQLRDYFDGVTIQGKGVLATEGIISIPLVDHGCPVSYKSHFYEFIDTEDGEIYLLHELKQDRLYEVVITTRGGLYRYRLNDIIKVTSYFKGLPCIEFIGKSSIVSDFFGEKINEMHVRDILDRLDISEEFVFLAPCKDNEQFYYTLFLNETLIERTDEIKCFVEEELKKNFHYKYARDLGQIRDLRIFIMTGDYERIYYDYMAKKKEMKLGDIKFQMLVNFIGFNEAIDGKLIMER